MSRRDLSLFLRLARRWGPPILWMAGIFIFSSRSRPLGPASRSEHRTAIGRTAHVAEYAGLAALVYRAVANGEKGRRAPSIALAISFAYAILDELHQESVAGRGFEWADVGCDLVGAVMALGLIRIRGAVRHRAPGSH